MTLEKEDLEHEIASDLALRNRNWDELNTQLERLDTFITELENTYNKRIIDKGSKKDGNSSHFYEKYADGTAKAWGFREVTVDFTSSLGDFYRASEQVDFNNMIDFFNNDKLVVLCDARPATDSQTYNIIPMTPNSTNPFRRRLLYASTSSRTDATIRLSYQITGEPIV